MDAVRTVPSSRFGWPGARLVYRIHAEGASRVTVPEGPGCVDAQVSVTESTPSSWDGLLVVTPRPDAGFD